MPRTTDISHSLDVSIRLSTPTTASQSFIPSFTTGDVITGTILVAARGDVAFQDLHVVLTGKFTSIHLRPILTHTRGAADRRSWCGP